MRFIVWIGVIYFQFSMVHMKESEGSAEVKRLFYVSYEQIPQLKEQYIDYFVVLLSHSELNTDLAKQYKELSDETLKILSINAQIEPTPELYFGICENVNQSEPEQIILYKANRKFLVSSGLAFNTKASQQFILENLLEQIKVIHNESELERFFALNHSKMLIYEKNSDQMKFKTLEYLYDQVFENLQLEHVFYTQKQFPNFDRKDSFVALFNNYTGKTHFLEVDYLDQMEFILVTRAEILPNLPKLTYNNQNLVLQNCLLTQIHVFLAHNEDTTEVEAAADYNRFQDLHSNRVQFVLHEVQDSDRDIIRSQPNVFSAEEDPIQGSRVFSQIQELQEKGVKSLPQLVAEVKLSEGEYIQFSLEGKDCLNYDVIFKFIEDVRLKRAERHFYSEENEESWKYGHLKKIVASTFRQEVMAYNNRSAIALFWNSKNSQSAGIYFEMFKNFFQSYDSEDWKLLLEFKFIDVAKNAHQNFVSSLDPYIKLFHHGYKHKPQTFQDNLAADNLRGFLNYWVRDLKIRTFEEKNQVLSLGSTTDL